MTDLIIKWRFKNKDWIEYSFCKNEKDFYSLIQRRYRVDKDKVEIIKIELAIKNELNS